MGPIGKASLHPAIDGTTTNVHRQENIIRIIAEKEEEEEEEARSSVFINAPLRSDDSLRPLI